MSRKWDGICCHPNQSIRLPVHLLCVSSSISQKRDSESLNVKSEQRFPASVSAAGFDGCFCCCDGRRASHMAEGCSVCARVCIRPVGVCVGDCVGVCEPDSRFSLL